MNSFPLDVSPTQEELNSTAEPIASAVEHDHVSQPQNVAQTSTDRKVTDNDTSSPQTSSKKLTVAKKPSRKRKWKKPKDMPKRPLSAYNLFFAHERQEMLKVGSLQGASSDSDLLDGASKKTMGFAGLARTIAAKWKSLSQDIKSSYEEQAEKEQERYKKELKEWKRTQEERKNRDQQFQAQLAAAGQMGLNSAAMAHFQATRSLSDSFMEIHQNISAVGPMFDDNVSIANMENANTAPIWPASAQTIANLGNIYDASVEQEALDSNLARSLMGLSATPASDSLRRLTQSQFGDFSTTQPSSLADQTQALNTATFPPLVTSRTGQSANIASPHRINNLASQLDPESFDFLSSLKNNGQEQGGK